MNLNKREKWKTGGFWQCKYAIKVPQILTGNKPMHQNFCFFYTESYTRNISKEGKKLQKEMKDQHVNKKNRRTAFVT